MLHKFQSPDVIRSNYDGEARVKENQTVKELNDSTQPGFKDAADVLEFLASLPTPNEIVELCPSKTLQDRISSLLEKNRTSGLTPEENQEWEQYQYLEHLVRIAKAKALLKLKNS